MKHESRKMLQNYPINFLKFFNIHLEEIRQNAHISPQEPPHGSGRILGRELCL